MQSNAGAMRLGRCARWGGGIAILLLLVAIGTAPGSAPVSASGVTVKMQPGNTYSPADITVQQGTTVTWVSEDMIEIHNVLEGDGAFGSPDLAYHQSWSFTFGPNLQPGTYYYYCTFHGAMTGSVTLLPPPTPTPNPQPTRHATTAPTMPVNVLPATHVAVSTKAGTILAQPLRH